MSRAENIFSISRFFSTNFFEYLLNFSACDYIRQDTSHIRGVCAKSKELNEGVVFSLKGRVAYSQRQQKLVKYAQHIKEHKSDKIMTCRELT